MGSTRCSLTELKTPVDNPTRVITTLDRHLEHEVSLIVYGRGALCLGFDHPNGKFAVTQDVDGIIPLSQLDDLTNDVQFWEAINATNEELEPSGLYLTHLFREDQVILRSDWERDIVPLRRPETRFLKLFRPASIDLVLTKMMRGNDEEDLSDIEFLIRHDRINAQAIEQALREAVIPDIPELVEAFEKARPTVVEITNRISSSGEM